MDDDVVGWAQNLLFITSAAGMEFLAVGSPDFNYLQTQTSKSSKPSKQQKQQQPSKIKPAAAVPNPTTISRQELFCKLMATKLSSRKRGKFCVDTGVLTYQTPVLDSRDILLKTGLVWFGLVLTYQTPVLDS